MRRKGAYMEGTWTTEMAICGICGRRATGELPETWNLSAMYKGKLVAPVCNRHEIEEKADGENHVRDMP
jgi:hypothetical protein